MDTTRTRRMRASAILGLAAAALLILPHQVRADGASVLINVGLGITAHLLVGNALIGLAEGVLIALVFRSKFRRAIPIMILANYASAWLAYMLLWSFGEQPISRLLGNEPLYAFPTVVKWVVLAAFVETVLVEWPFCLWAIKPGTHRLARSAGACLVAQVASYAVLIPFYQGASLATLYRSFAADRATVSEAPASIVVYFMSVKEDAVCRINLNGTARTHVCQLDPQRWQGLFFRKGGDGQGWDLCRSYSLPEGGEQQVALLTNLPVRAAGWRYHGEGPEEAGPYRSGSQVCELRAEPDPRWTVTGAKDVLYLRDNRSQQYEFIGFGTPFLIWYATQPTMLPGDLVVCQFGDQILLIDLQRRRVGLLAMGHSPVVGILKQAPATQATGAAPTTSSAAAP